MNEEVIWTMAQNAVLLERFWREVFCVLSDYRIGFTDDGRAQHMGVGGIGCYRDSLY